MNEYRFYGPDAVEMVEDEFVNFYSGCYYIGGEKIPRLSQNSRCTESEIDRLLKCGIRTKADVVHILAWKIGKIKHGESERSSKFVYAKDWKQAEKFDVMRYGKPFELERIATFIADHIDELEQQANENPQAVLDRLRGENYGGLGSVYLITLLYFISKGKYPIYDRFAKMALSAIRNHVKPGGVVDYEELPEKTSKAFSNIMEKDMKEYIDELKQVFGDKYLNGRDVDRALWVYGHLFKLK